MSEQKVKSRCRPTACAVTTHSQCLLQAPFRESVATNNWLSWLWVRHPFHKGDDMAHRPYAKVPGAPPSVTTVLSMLSTPGLSWGAARETAKYAVHHQDQWCDLPSEAAVDTLYRHHKGVWDHRALLGSALHHINAEWCKGHTIRTSEVIQQMRSESRLWARTPDTQIYADLMPMVRGLQKVWDRLQPETLSSEQVVRYQGVPGLDYIGTADWRCVINGEPYLLDLKTTGKTGLGEAKYWDTWRLQLAAYRYATEALTYDEEGQVKGSLDLPPVSGCAILHIYGNGQWQIDGVQAGPAEHEVFLSLVRAYKWRQKAQGEPGEDAALISWLAS